MWFKVLNPDYTQNRGRKEMFEYYAAAPKVSLSAMHVWCHCNFGADKQLEQIQQLN
jgi:hypothetical protein